MRLQFSEYQDGVAIIEPIGAMVKTTVLQQFVNMISSLVAKGRTAFLFDLFRVSRVSMSALVALVELPAMFQRLQIAFSDLPASVTRKLESTGVDRGLKIFQTKQDAMCSNDFLIHCLTRTRAIVFCDRIEHGFQAIAPSLKPVMLDAFGEPVVARALQHLGRFGVKQSFLTLEQGEKHIHTYFEANPPVDQSIVYCRTDCTRFKQHLKGARSRQLGVLQDAHFAIHGDTIVTFGADVNDVNLAEMMFYHKVQGADFTFAAKKCSEFEYTQALSENPATNLITLASAQDADPYAGTPVFETGAFIISQNAASLIAKNRPILISVNWQSLSQRMEGVSCAMIKRRR